MRVRALVLVLGPAEPAWAEVVSARSVWTVRPSRPVSEHPMSVPVVVLGPAEPVRAQVVSARSV
jgi:hypothetical protein